jgi:hypothetical protein
MNIGQRRGRLGWTVAVVLAGTVIGVTGCRPTPTAASGTTTHRPAATATAVVDRGTHVRGMVGVFVKPDGALVLVRPDEARKFGHLG